MNVAALNKFIVLSSTRYHDRPATDEHESEHDYGHKTAWGRAGIASMRELARAAGGVGSFHHNRSGSIDRGYVTGFISSPDGSKHVYVQISDSGFGGPVLYRTASSTTDYSGGSNNFTRIDLDGFSRVLSFIERHFNG